MPNYTDPNTIPMPEKELTLDEFKTTFQFLLDAFQQYDKPKIQTLRQVIFSNFPLTYSSFKIQASGLKTILFHEVLEWPLKTVHEASILEYDNTKYLKFQEKQPNAYELLKKIARNTNFLFDRLDYIFCHFWSKYYPYHEEAKKYITPNLTTSFSDNECINRDMALLLSDEEKNMTAKNAKQKELRDFYRISEDMLLLYGIFLPFHIIKTTEGAIPFFYELKKDGSHFANTLNKAHSTPSPQAKADADDFLIHISQPAENIPELQKLYQLERAFSYALHFELFYDLMIQAETETTYLLTECQPRATRAHPFLHYKHNSTFTSRIAYAKKYNQLPELEKLAVISASICHSCRNCKRNNCSGCQFANDSLAASRELVLSLIPKEKQDTKDSESNIAED